jgi:hypothetical protein
MVSRGKEWETSFDLTIFIQLSTKERIKRLENREPERYREKLLTDKICNGIQQYSWNGLTNTKIQILKIGHLKFIIIG